MRCCIYENMILQYLPRSACLCLVYIHVSACQMCVYEGQWVSVCADGHVGV